MKKICILICLIAISPWLKAQNTDLSGGVIWESEPFMALDPSTPQHIVVGWMGTVPGVHTSIKTIVSYNGGATWSAPVAIPHIAGTYTSADVSMAFDHNNNLFMSYIDHSENNDSGGVYVVMSTDGGLSWGAPSKVIDGYADPGKAPLDRPWIAIGKAIGAAPDTLYVTTKPAPWIPVPNRPYFMMSTDSAQSWTPWRYIDTTGYFVGNDIQAPMAAPATDSAGRFHCMYPVYVPSVSVYPRFILATHQLPNTFSYNAAYSVVGAAQVDTMAKVGYRLICDPTKNNHLAFFTITAWDGDADVFCTESFDGGNTWGSHQRVNDDAVGNGKMQDMVWANFDEHGNIIAAWRDRRNSPDTGYEEPAEIWGAIKWADSSAFSANFQISDTAAPYDSIYLDRAGNDFMNVAMAQDTMSAVWGDDRTGALNIWFARRDMATGTTVVKNIVHEQTPIVQLFPDPAKTVLNVAGKDITTVDLYDMVGRLLLHHAVHTLPDKIDISKLRAGVYSAHIQTDQGLVTIEVVKQ